jgi:hypothetical protein
VDELVQRDLFIPESMESTPPMEIRQSVAEYVESFHSRNGFSRNRMTPAQAAGFDDAVTRLVTPFSMQGALTLHITARVVTGKPRDAKKVSATA